MANNRVMYTFKNWRLRRNDPQNLVIERKARIKDPKTGEVRDNWQFVGYYSTLQSALNSLADKIGFNSDSLDEAAREIHEHRQAVERLLKVME
jgi:hypothetical protein